MIATDKLQAAEVFEDKENRDLSNSSEEINCEGLKESIEGK